MPKTSMQITGIRGEELACEFLMQKGFTILGRNIHLGSYEIDIIAGDDSYILFVEVKTRIEYPDTNYGSAAGAVSMTKQRNLIAAAEVYIRKVLKNDTSDRQPRIDVIEVYLPMSNGKNESQLPKIRHIKNAVYRR